MKYKIILSPLAEEHMEYWAKSGNTSAKNKLSDIFTELETHPTTGTGKPEKLRGNLSGYWSRRITKTDRIVYNINDTEVHVSIISLKSHYGQK